MCVTVTCYNCKNIRFPFPANKPKKAPGGWPEISFLNALCYQNAPERPERTFGSPSEEAWSIVDVDRAHRSISIFRSGAGNDFSTDF